MIAESTQRTGAFELTAEQHAIVKASLEGPHVVDAGAGSGKTLTLVQRAADLVLRRDATPRQLLVVTFTNKAAIEIGTRLTATFGDRGIHDLPTCATFHGLASQLLKAYAYEGEFSPDLRVIENAEARALFRTAFASLLADELGVDTSALPLLDRQPELVRSLAYLALDLKARQVSIDTFEREALAASDALERQTFGWVWTPQKSGKGVLKSETGPYPERTPPERIAEAAAERLNVRAVAALFRRFDEVLRAEGAMTFGDLLWHATWLLQNRPEVAAQIRRRWTHAMVDEFQDTNPGQLTLLRAIFGEDLQRVMAIGDIRQSIYAFNGAEPAGFVAFRDTLARNRFELTINRRSYQEILDAAGGVLDLQGDPIIPQAHGLRAHKGSGGLDAVRCRTFSASTVPVGRELEAAAIADEIQSLRARGVSATSIAILLRSRTHASVYSEALLERGIAVKTHGGVGFFDAAEIMDAVAWLRFLLDTSDRTSLVRVLGSAAVGLSDGALAHLAFEPSGLTQAALYEPLPAWLDPLERRHLERFRALAARLAPTTTVPLSECLRAIVRETGLALAHSQGDSLEAEQARANLEKLEQLAVGFEHRHTAARARDFLAWLDEWNADENDEPEAELQTEHVAIMTVHAAKGLEWDYVFVANVADSVFPSRGRSNDSVVERDRTSNALAFANSVEGVEPLRWAMRKPHDPLNGRRIEPPGGKKAVNAEEARLFYVAMTRAKHRLYVSGAAKPTTKSNGESVFVTRLREFASESGIELAPFGPAAAIETSRAQPGEAASHASRPIRPPESGVSVERLARRAARRDAPRLLPDADVRLSYTAIATYETCPRLARYRYVLGMPDLRDGEYLPSHTSEASDPARDRMDPALFGTVVHRVLELHAIAGREGALLSDMRALVEIALAEVDRGDDAELAVRTASAAEAAIVALGALTPVEAELEFDIAIAQTRVFGFIDLLARDASGNDVVIDYKTGRGPDEHYVLQLAIYRRVVRELYGADCTPMLLRVGAASAELVAMPLMDDAAVNAAVTAARGLRGDTPRPGVHCLSCPYAGALCPEGARQKENSRV